MTSPTPAPETIDADPGPLTDAATRVTGALFELGRLWAAHGLTVGRSALHTSAETLRTTAEVLGDLAERFEDEERSEPGEEQPAA